MDSKLLQLPPFDFSSQATSPVKADTGLIATQDTPLLQRRLSIKRSMSTASARSDLHLRARKSKTASLFQLFSKPNVEKARGYNEHDMQYPPLPDTALYDNASETCDTFQSSRSDERSSTPTSNTFATAPTSTTPPSRKSHPSNAIFDLPPLFQAYPQAVKFASLEAVDQSFSQSSTTEQHGIRSRQSTDFAGLRGTALKRASINRAMSCFQDQHRGVRKVHVLVEAGYMLEYTGDGAFDRLPEASLKLGKDSAAFASDLVPGKPWVLQVVQAPATVASTPPLRSQRSFFSRMGMQKSQISRPVTSLLLICESADDLDEWMAAIRKEIEFLGGKRYHAPGQVRSSVDDEGYQISPSHRYPALARQASQASSHSSAISNNTAPTMTDSRTSNTFTMSGSDRSNRRISSRKFSDPPRLSFYATSDDYLDLMPDLPTSDFGTPTDSYATVSITSSPDMQDSEIRPDNVQVSSAWDASLRDDPYTATDDADLSTNLVNWPLPQQYYTVNTKIQQLPIPSTPLDFDPTTYQMASSSLPKAMIPLRSSSSKPNMKDPQASPTRKQKGHALAAEMQAQPQRRPSPPSGTGARLSLYPLPLRVSIDPESIALARLSRSSQTTMSPSSPSFNINNYTTSPLLAGRRSPGPNSTLRRPPSMPISTDPTPFLSQNRDRPPRAVMSSNVGLGVGGEGLAGNERLRGNRASTGRIRGRKGAPLLLSLPPPTAPPTGPLPMLPTSAALMRR